jgi:metal-dependent amidase/aminoacylase/carboxypeptidase family protein
MISIIKNLRKELHQYPEVSGKEVNTAKRIKAFIEKHHPTEIIENIGGNALAVVYESGKQGKIIVI